MNVGMSRGTQAMLASERRLASVTSNLANLRSTAYKRVAAVHHAQADAVGGEHGEIETRVSLDWTQGRLERTGLGTDLALQGDGFFAVEGPTGELYTRDGSFHLTEEGVLVTQEGHPVAWDGGRGTIDPIGEAVRVDLDGSVVQGQNQVGRLKLVDFADRDQLDQLPRGYFEAAPELGRTPAQAEVHQFALEGSNVSSVEELVRLIETQRSFESASKVVQLIGESYQRLANSHSR